MRPALIRAMLVRGTPINFVIVAAVMVVAMSGGAGHEASAASGSTNADVVAKILPSVVSISGLRAPAVASAPAPSRVNASDRTAASATPRGTRVLGSGFVIDAAGIIATNRHVVEHMTQILVTLQDNTLLRATMLAQSDQMDVALLKVTPDSALPAVRFADSDGVRVADPVLAIGNPLSLGGTVTQGIVSALNRDIRETPFDDFIQTDAAINHGNSGGPLFNLQGEVIGMNTAIFSPEASSGSIGLGFAIPSNDLRFVAGALRDGGGARAGTLNFRIQQVTPEIADALNMSKAEGVIVGGTTDRGGASRCGILAGDIILRYGATDVKDVRALARSIARTPPGTVVKLLIWRNEEPTVIAATIQEAPREPQPIEDTIPSAPAGADPGWQLAAVDAKGNANAANREAVPRVTIAAVEANGAAAEAGLTAGDVIVQIQQEKVASPDDARRLMSLARQQQRHYVVVLVQGAGGLRWVPMGLD